MNRINHRIKQWGAALLLATTGFAAQAGPGADQLAQFSTKVQSLSANFTQTLLDEDYQPLEYSSGTMTLERPGRFRWEYAHPYRQLIISDGVQVSLYDEDLEQMTVRAIGKAFSGTPAELLAGGDVDKQFTLKELGDGSGLIWLGLEPTDKDSDFRQIRLGFRSDKLEVMDLIDQFDQTTQVRFTDIEHNPQVKPADFKFEPPEGTEIVREDPA